MPSKKAIEDDRKAAHWDLIDSTVSKEGPLVCELLECSVCGAANIHLHPFCGCVDCECGNQIRTKWELSIMGRLFAESEGEG